MWAPGIVSRIITRSLSGVTGLVAGASTSAGAFTWDSSCVMLTPGTIRQSPCNTWVGVFQSFADNQLDMSRAGAGEAAAPAINRRLDHPPEPSLPSAVSQFS